MSKEKGKTQNEKRKLTRQEKKQIDALIRQSKGDGKPHTAQDSIPFERMYKDGICRLANGRYSKCIEFEDINYQLAQPDDKTAIFEALCDMYNSFDASISVQLSLISRHANKDDFKNSITIAPQNDDFDSIRAEFSMWIWKTSTSPMFPFTLWARNSYPCTLCICRRLGTDPTFSRNPAIFQNTMKTRQRIMKSRPPIWKMNSLRGSLRKRKSMSVFLMCGAAAARKPLLIAAVLLAMC